MLFCEFSCTVIVPKTICGHVGQSTSHIGNHHRKRWELQVIKVNLMRLREPRARLSRRVGAQSGKTHYNGDTETVVGSDIDRRIESDARFEGYIACTAFKSPDELSRLSGLFFCVF